MDRASIVHPKEHRGLFAPWSWALTPFRAAVAFVALAVVTRLPGLVAPRVFNPDESTVGIMARVMASGGNLYIDVVDRKPPGLFLIYWSIDRLTGVADLRLTRLVALVAVAATSWLLAVEARRRFRSTLPVGLLAAVGLLIFTLLPARDTQSVSFEALAMLPATIAFVLAARGRTAGAAFATAIATLCKQTFILGLIPVLYHSYRRHGWAGVARDGAICLASIAMAAPFFGGRPFFYWSFLEAAGYAADAGVLARALVALVVMVALLGALLLGPLLLASAAPRRWQPDLVLWLAGGALAYVAGMRFLTHYAFQLLPPLALLAMGGLAVPGWRRRIGVGLVGVVSVVWLAAGLLTLGQQDPYQPVAGYLRSTTAPSDRVFVWGQSSQIYWQADRLPASRFPHIQFLTNLTPRPGDTGEEQPDYVTTLASWQDLWADFRAHPPEVILDSTKVNGGSIANARLEASPLWAYVRSGYEQSRTMDGIVVWRRLPPDTLVTSRP